MAEESNRADISTKAALLLALVLVAACAAAPEARTANPRRFEERRVAMGVQARIVLYAHSEEDARAAFRAAFARIETLEEALSDWRPSSEISRLNASAGGPPQRVSADLLGALERSVEMARATHGAFDPTVGAVVALWREARTEGRAPSPEAIRDARSATGFEKVELDPAHRSARLASAGMRLDLGAIGKGLACDEALSSLAAAGIDSALVEIGGDLAAGDPPPGKDGWSVAEGSRLVVVRNEGLAGSGDTEQHTDDGGVSYSHIVDPRTGMGVRDSLPTFVRAKDGATADALATAASVLGPEEGGKLVESLGAEMFVDDPRMTSLFDGKTLAGWTTRGGRYDGEAIWTVEDGCIVGRVNEKGEGGLIYTDRPYTSFVFECDVSMDAPFDSGVFVRMVPPAEEKKGAQITLDDRPDGEIGAVYADGFLAHGEPAPGKLWKRGAWNRVKVEVTGFDLHVRAWINGRLAADHALPPNTPGFAPTGLLGLQVHGGMGEPKSSAARFRDVRIRELPVFEAAAAGDWKPLFDGVTLAGWQEHGTQGAWRAHDGVLGCRYGKEGGELRTEDDFQDFDLRLEFKIARMANSGVFLRAKRDDSNPAFSGCEIQILDDFNWEKETKTTLKPWQFTGSLYGSVPAGARGALRPVGEWNAYEILCRGDRIAVALNGRTLYDVDVTHVPGDPPFASRARSGFIGLQLHASDGPGDEDAVSFRNVEVRR